jgi:hypothetical protein
MAVDSNVLIFERIAKSCGRARRFRRLWMRAFGKAWWTIVDTHVTTIVSCLFLFLFGTGPGQGLRRDAGDRPLRQRVYGGLGVADDLRLGTLRKRRRQVTVLSI